MVFHLDDRFKSEGIVINWPESDSPASSSVQPLISSPISAEARKAASDGEVSCHHMGDENHKLKPRPLKSMFSMF